MSGRKQYHAPCIYCNGSNDGKSSICTRPACLARYWRKMAEQARDSARDYDKRAADLEAEARLDAVDGVAVDRLVADQAAELGLPPSLLDGKPGTVTQGGGQ